MVRIIKKRHFQSQLQIYLRDSIILLKWDISSSFLLLSRLKISNFQGTAMICSFLSTVLLLHIEHRGHAFWEGGRGLNLHLANEIHLKYRRWEIWILNVSMYYVDCRKKFLKEISKQTQSYHSVTEDRSLKNYVFW